MSLCPWEPATYFGFYSSNVPELLYYSHIPAIVVALFWGLYIFFRTKKDPKAHSLLLMFLAFIAWATFDLILWATNRPDVTIFFWSLQVLLEPLTFALAFYLVYRYINSRELSIRTTLVVFVALLPFILLIPTDLNLIGVYQSDCTAIENVVARYYSYILEAIFIIAISILALEGYRNAPNKSRKAEIALFSLGIFLFLMFFIYGNLIGSYLDDWELAQYGLFGMPIFVTFLVYTIVKFRSFNVRILGAQALVVGLIALIATQFSFIQDRTSIILNIVALILSVVFGIQLIKSVRKEVEAREFIQKQKDQLEKANARLKELDKQKTEFISFATHQLRSPLTAIRGVASLILEGDMGHVPDKVKESVQMISTSIKTQINIVEDYLNVSRIELGTMKYSLVDLDFKDLACEAIDELKSNIEAKGLSYKFSTDGKEPYKISADPDKFKQVVMNTIDNSVKYTEKGSIDISLSKDEKKGVAVLRIADTGVGIDPAVMPKLFEKFIRAPQASEHNIHGTGLGLFIAKEIMNAHQGRIWAESEGEGKGSQFYIEIPLAK